MDKDQEIYNKGILTSTLQSVNQEIEELKSNILFLYDETQPNDETKNELDMVLVILSESQERLSKVIKNNSDDEYIPYA
jgi:hypothetical protein